MRNNIGYACTGAQCQRGLSDKRAFRWLGGHGEIMDCTFQELDQGSSRFANVLQRLGYGKGDVFFTFLPKVPEQFIAILGSLKLCLITGTLFSNFGEDALFDRLADSRANGIITRRSYLKKITAILTKLPDLKHIILVDAEDHVSGEILSLPALMDGCSADFTVPETSPDTPSLLHYTSGSTGKPKGALHCHGSLPLQVRTAQEVLDLREDDIFWCTAEQGWVTGTSYGVIAPWSLGVTQIHHGGAYDADDWFRTLETERVTVWYTAPTALRMLMREDESIFRKFDLSRLRHIASVGEPLNPEVINWGRRVLGKEIYDTWFQTETGAIMIANSPRITIRPGSMGVPLCGIEAAIVADDGTAVQDGSQGNLCLRPGWDSMFITYLGNDKVYWQKFREGWYWTGDTARRDSEGYFWFMGRSDDIINTAGHLISPFEAECALLEVPEIAESGVIGVPDDLLFEKVVAFVALHKGKEWSEELELRVRLHVANKASSVATPQEIFVLESIPKNKSGKIMRRVLKACYLGQDPGDISTLED